MNGRVLCMGCVNMDLVMPVDHLPQKGETVLSHHFWTFPGGKSGNQAVAASSFGSDVEMFTKLGDDSFSQSLLDSLESHRVNTSHIQKVAGQTSGIAMIQVDPSGNNAISFTPGANALVTSRDVLDHAHLFQSGSILLITLEMSMETILQALRTAREKGMYIILDPAPAPKQAIPEEIISLAHCIKPNETEASQLTGIHVYDRETAIESCRKMRQMGVLLPIITLGEHGVVAMHGDEVMCIAPIKVNAVDSTAAGDVFSGGLAACLSRSEPMEKALAFANAAAALSTTRHGAQTSIPTLSEVRSWRSAQG